MICNLGRTPVLRDIGILRSPPISPMAVLASLTVCPQCNRGRRFRRGGRSRDRLSPNVKSPWTHAPGMPRQRRLSSAFSDSLSSRTGLCGHRCVDFRAVAELSDGRSSPRTRRHIESFRTGSANPGSQARLFRAMGTGCGRRPRIGLQPRRGVSEGVVQHRCTA
jgi:hypothetical protein